MKLGTNKRALRNAVARVWPMVGSAPLGADRPGILVSASHDSSGQYLTVAAGEGTVDLSVKIAAKVARAGSFVADAPALRKALAGGRAGDMVAFALDDETRIIGGAGDAPAVQAWLATESARHAIPQADADPVAVGLDAGGTRATWQSADLGEALRRVSFAMSEEETRYYLRGVYIAQEGGALAMTATDGHRLAATQTTLSPGASDWPEGGIILPALAVRAIAKATGGEPHKIAVRANASGAIFDGPDYWIAVRAVDGTYPDYKRVFPDPEAKGRARVSFDLGGFGGAIRAAKPVPGESILLNAYPQIGGRIALDNGPRIEGEGIRFNARYLADIAGAIGGEATMNYDPANRDPALFLAPNLPGFAALLMPVGG